MVLTPDRIYEDFTNNKINKLKAYDLLISLIENSDNEEIRIRSIKYLELVGIYNEKLFKLLENILISDINRDIRIIAAKILGNKFLGKSINLFKWVIRHETDYECLIIIIKSLEKTGTNESKSILFKELKKVIKTKYINKQKRIQNTKFKSIIKKLIKSKKYIQFTHNELSEILINYYTIINLIIKFPNVFYEINPQNGLIEKLDLSDFLEHEVKGTPFGWKNNIKSISEIIGIENLTQIKVIDLSNNQIEDIKDLIVLNKLTHLILTNNKIKNLDNLEIIKLFPNLVYLDLRNNEIINKISPNEFNKNIRILLKDYIILK